MTKTEGDDKLPAPRSQPSGLERVRSLHRRFSAKNKKMSSSNELTKSEKEAKPQIKIGHYILKETLGVGTFGKVKVGIHEATGYKVAIKILNRNKIKTLDVVGKIRREIQNLSLFKHPHIIRLYQVISTPTEIFMIMEHVSGGELFEYIVKHGRLKPDEARNFFQQIISGVDYCHRHIKRIPWVFFKRKISGKLKLINSFYMVVHRDLKPENLLLDDKNRVKIADFGLSNIMIDGDFLRTSCGSPNYAAPEVISGKLYAGPEVDVWSAGVILYALLCGTLPFDDESMPALFRKIKSGIFPIPDYLEKSVVNLLLHMLQVDAIKRATIKDVINHEWFRVNLPAYLFPPVNEGDASIIDIDAIRDVSRRFNVTEEDVTNALLGDDPHDKLSVAYNLIVDNKRIASEMGQAQHLHPLAIMQRSGGPVLDNPTPAVVIHSRNNSGRMNQCPADPKKKKAITQCDACPSKGADGCPFPDNSYKTGRQRSATEQSTQKKPAKMSLENFYHIAPASKLLQADQARNPERMNPTTKITPNLEYKEQAAVSPQGSKTSHIKRAKWHLGIRSQSNPMDIMYEVFRAMKHLGFEWKILQAYHCIVRKKPTDPKIEMPKMSLQLYQVDPRNYLLDFKNLVDDDGSISSETGSFASRHGSVSMPVRPSLRNARAQSLPMSVDVIKVQRAATAQASASAELNRQSQTMQFFEMCAALIGALAR